MNLREFGLWIFVSLGFLMGGALSAGDVTPVSMCAQVVRPFQMTSGSTQFTDHLWVASSDSMHLSVFLPTSDFSLTLVSPSGVTTLWDPTSTAVSCRKVTVQQEAQSPILGYAYHFTFPSPANGNWVLTANTPTVLISDWKGLLTADFVSDINAAIFLTTQKTFLGQSVTASLAVVEGATMLNNYQYEAKLYRAGDLVSSAPTVTFENTPSTQGGPSTMTATLTPAQAGDYTLVVNIGGTSTAGTFARTATAGFTIFPQKAKLTGQINQRLKISFPKPPQ